MVVEEEQPNTSVPSPSSSPELQVGKLCNGSQSPEVKVVPLSELSNLFTNGYKREDSKCESTKSESDSGDLSPSPQPLKESVDSNEEVIEENHNQRAGYDSNDSSVSPVDQENHSESSTKPSSGKLNNKFRRYILREHEKIF